MKKIYLATLFAIMTISLSACGKDSDTSNEIEELKEQIEELKEENKELKSENNELKGNSDTTIDSESEQPTENNEPDELNNFVAETSGVCGADLTWEYGNGILRIHGTGEMSNFDEDNKPWEDVFERINHIYIDEGCTSIGSRAFYNNNLNSQISKVVLPSTLKNIGPEAFYYYNFNLKEIELPSGLESIGRRAFGYNPFLTIEGIPNTVTQIGVDAFEDTAIKEITIPDDIDVFGINAVSYDWENNHESEQETIITWRGNTYTGCGRDSELITKMREAGVEIIEE